MSWLSNIIKNPAKGIVGLVGGSGIFDKPKGFEPTSATLISPFEQEQAKQLYEQTQAAYNQQQAFVNALNQQNALANQANVFRQLQDVASGVGPNPALAALQQATGQNIAAQNALMAGQRGGSRNVGLLARQAGQQGGGIQQQAAGQGATLQAQQQLGALGQLGGLANQQAAQLQAGIGTLGQMGLSGQQNILDAIARQNATAVNQQNVLNQINADVAARRAAQQSGLIGSIGKILPTVAGTILGGPIGGMIGSGISNIIGSGAEAMGMLPGLNQGGMVPEKQKYAMGGMAANQPQSFVGQYFSNPNQMLGAINQSDNLRDSQLDYSTLADGGAVNRDGMYAKGGMAPMSLMKQGGHVPGKAVVAGDSYKNDIVDAKLSPGEIVIPRSIVNHPNAAKLAAKFVQDTINKKKGYADGGEVEDDNVSLSDDIEDADYEDIDTTANNQAIDQSVLKQTTKALPQFSAEQAYSDSQIAGPSTTQKGLEMVQRSYREEAQAEKEKAAANVAAIQEAQDLIKAKNLEYDMHRQQTLKKINDLEQDINNYKIDPKRFYSNMGTMESIANVIGLIMGGIGEAGTGRENGALIYLENQIKNDIEQQKSELGKKQTLLEANYRDLGNLNEAVSMTNAMMTNNLAREMDKVANQYAGTIQGARLKQAAGMLNAKTGSYIDQLAQYRAYTSPSRGTASTGAVAPKQIPRSIDPKKNVRIDTEDGVFYANNPAQKEKVLNQLNSIQEARNALKEMKNIEDLGFFTKVGIAGQEFGAGFLNETSARVEQGKQALENLKQRYAEAEAARLGIKNPSKVKIPENLFPSIPTDVNFTDAELVKYKNLKKKLAADQANILKQLSSSPFNPVKKSQEE